MLITPSGSRNVNIATVTKGGKQYVQVLIQVDPDTIDAAPPSSTDKSNVIASTGGFKPIAVVGDRKVRLNTVLVVDKEKPVVRALPRRR